MYWNLKFYARLLKIQNQDESRRIKNVKNRPNVCASPATLARRIAPSDETVKSFHFAVLAKIQFSTFGNIVYFLSICFFFS